MTAHGMICCGRTMEEAFDHCLKLEDCCRQYIEEGYERDEQIMDIKEILETALLLCRGCDQRSLTAEVPS